MTMDCWLIGPLNNSTKDPKKKDLVLFSVVVVVFSRWQFKWVIAWGKRKEKKSLFTKKSIKAELSEKKMNLKFLM